LIGLSALWHLVLQPGTARFYRNGFLNMRKQKTSDEMRALFLTAAFILKTAEKPYSFVRAVLKLEARECLGVIFPNAIPPFIIGANYTCIPVSDLHPPTRQKYNQALRALEKGGLTIGLARKLLRDPG
jgi:hypothetical protein